MIRIRVAQQADIADIFDVRGSVRENPLSIEELAALGITENSVADMIAAEPCAWVAQAGARIVGFAMADADTGGVFALFVRPEWEVQGLGSLLLRKAEAFLFSRHAVLWLETDSRSRASPFYQRRGWQATRTLAGTDVRFEKRRTPAA
ncbi:Histone acetyltransferase HPA2 and related acetyltransferases [plant metagenome]|uniref:Histone acetyltransferase HPA2 and related acetyltransferases n=1 Tax=plant metagenome TaxID=1297885 RepID=A0A484QT41_9ZZZZ